MLTSFLLYAARHGATAGELWLIGLIALLPIADVTISLLNLLVTTQVPPRQLPKLDLRNGIPAGDQTFVVVPVIIDTEAHVDELIADLEVRFLANREQHLHFALLTDFPDADQASMPADEALVERASRGIAELNARHGEDRFFLFHRERRWNAREQRWMGWERKRGKLARVQPAASRRDRHQLRRHARPARPAAVAPATSSRSTRTRSCRSTPRARSSARSRTRSTGRGSTRA